MARVLRRLERVKKRGSTQGIQAMDRQNILKAAVVIWSCRTKSIAPAVATLSIQRLLEALGVLDLHEMDGTSRLICEHMAVVNGGSNRTARAGASEMPCQGVRARKVFRASRATRTERIGDFKLFLYVYPFGVFELHVATSDEERFAADVVSFPVTFKVVCVLAGDKVARPVLDRFDQSTFARLWTRSGGNRMWAAEGTVFGLYFVRPRIARVPRVARFVVLLVVGPSGELFVASAAFRADIRTRELEDAGLSVLLSLCMVEMAMGLAILVGYFDTRPFAVVSAGRVHLLHDGTHLHVP